VVVDTTKASPGTIVASGVAALSEEGEGFSVACSQGSVVLPDEADNWEDALRIADQRMYAMKNSGRVSASRQTQDVLLTALFERSSELSDHLGDVGTMAALVAEEMGLNDEDVRQIRQAGELHDIGKIAIPDSILNKDGPLSESEWEFMRRHTVIGERILAAAPALANVGLLVRGSHERFDGEGYPDQTTGREIPLGARIVAVCDTFDAMTSDRPYRSARQVEEALTELRACSGSQFDPKVVAAFERVWERSGTVAEPA
jgi:HD-GYP domain-containing protein (c-di-GMP phosphodiesterase class II)